MSPTPGEGPGSCPPPPAPSQSPFVSSRLPALLATVTRWADCWCGLGPACAVRGSALARFGMHAVFTLPESLSADPDPVQHWPEALLWLLRQTGPLGCGPCPPGCPLGGCGPGAHTRFCCPPPLCSGGFGGSGWSLAKGTRPVHGQHLAFPWQRAPLPCAAWPEYGRLHTGLRPHQCHADPTLPCV